ncbi:MAG: GntR family transcriptional regulator [Chloroflexi bacterium]|nr:GntR family transcriptional regulator [Chloroflexota bacterium]
MSRRPGMAAYLQIEEEIAERIESGEIAPGQRIPPERVFCDQLGVSRMTVRQALGRLEQRGLLVRQQGRGTFASQPKIRQSATVLRGFFEEMVGQGLVPTSRLLSVEERVAPQSLAQALELRLGETVYTITRVRSANTSPVVLERSSFPTRLVPGLLDMDLEHSSIYRLLEESFDARPIRATQSMEAIPAESWEAGLLDVPVESPLMLVQRTAWDGRGRAVEHARDFYRADRSRFVTELRL